MIVHHSWIPIENAERTCFHHLVLNDFSHCISNGLTTHEANQLMLHLVPFFELGQGVNPFELRLTDSIGYRINSQHFPEIREMLRANGFTRNSDNRIRAILAITCTAILIPNQFTSIYRLEINLLFDTHPI